MSWMQGAGGAPMYYTLPPLPSMPPLPGMSTMPGIPMVPPMPITQTTSRTTDIRIPSKVAIITGASSGIGRATAIALSAAGWKLTIIARNAQKLEETKSLCIGSARGDVCVVVGDVTLEQDVERLFDTTLEQHGRLDLLFNNAGTCPPALRISSVSLELFNSTLETNVSSAFLCTREAFRLFAAQPAPNGGRIINNGSISAHVPRPHSIAYTVSKHAMTGLTRQTALDGRDVGIAVTQIDIGNAYTEMTSSIALSALQPNGERKPEPTFDAKHVADVIVHIASLPTSVSIPEMTIMATGMPYAGRG